MLICKHREREREILAAVFGAERFHTYVYGWSFTFESDHKPLESISRKNLADTPAWLQYMMLCLQGYDFTIHYCPGKEMVIPDTLSWFSPWPGPDLPLDITIHHAHIITRPQRISSKPPSMIQKCELLLTSSSLAGQRTSRKSLIPFAHTGNIERPSPSRWSTCDSSCWKGESPTSTASIPSGNNKVTVACTWKFLLPWH